MNKDAYCSSIYCDHHQLSAKGVKIPEAQPGVEKCPRCHQLLVWYDKNNIKYRSGFTFMRKYKKYENQEKNS